jgi:hypothetical protein
LHLARLFEDAKACDLGGEAFAMLRTVVRADPKEDQDTGFDFGDALVTDIDAGGANTLNDRAQLAHPPGLGAEADQCHSNIHGLSPRTTASTSGAERWPGVNTVMLLPSGRRVMNVTFPKR